VLPRPTAKAHPQERGTIVADFTGKAQFFVAFKCSAEHEAEGDRFFAQHAQWMERTHPKEGDTALLQYTVSTRLDGEGDVLFLLAEVYETSAGVENHSRLAHENEGEPDMASLRALVDKSETIGFGASDVVHSLW
jgi:hypothetical protein